jgi:hypothetical protein
LDLPRRLRSLWSAWSIGGRIFAVVLALQLVAAIVGLARVADQYYELHRIVRVRWLEPLHAAFSVRDRHRQFGRLFEQCRRDLPADARVLYVGRGEGHLLAYVLYPRPVFMHPSERYAAWVGHQLHDMDVTPEDALFPASFPPPEEALALEAFIESRRLTHRVEFAESDLSRSRWEAIH